MIHTARLLPLGVAVVALTALSACSDDSVMPEPQMPDTTQTTADADEIAYNVVGDNASRASQVYNANNMPTSFYVSAWALDADSTTEDIGHVYIKSDFIQNKGTASAQNWIDQSGQRYWPNNGEYLNFFATNSPNGYLDYKIEGTDANQSIIAPKYKISQTVNASAGQQNDLLYASAFAQYRTVSGAAGQKYQTVNLAFHHALSQVVFTAQCANPHIDVRIGNISVVGVAGEGTLEMSADRTTEAPNWSIPSTYTPGTFSTDPDGDAGATKVGSDVTPVTSDPSQSSYALMMLPQTVAAADPSQSNPWSGQKAYLKIQCIIYNVGHGENGSSNDAIDTMIFGTKTDMGGGFIRQDYGTLYLPLNVDWQMGKRYVYNLVFGQGNGGYDENGNSILIPIKYSTSVDNWVETPSTSVAGK